MLLAPTPLRGGSELGLTKEGIRIGSTAQTRHRQAHGLGSCVALLLTQVLFGSPAPVRSWQPNLSQQIYEHENGRLFGVNGRGLSFHWR
jgi:hypothetical protein